MDLIYVTTVGFDARVLSGLSDRFSDRTLVSAASGLTVDQYHWHEGFQPLIKGRKTTTRLFQTTGQEVDPRAEKDLGFQFISALCGSIRNVAVVFLPIMPLQLPKFKTKKLKNL